MRIKPRRLLSILFSIVVILIFSFASSPASAQLSVSPEYRTKANFLSQFPKFIDWPDSAFPSTQAPFLICMLSESSFGFSLAEITRGAVAKGRPIDVRLVRPEQDMRACQILFIGRSKRKQYEKLLEVLKGANVLTVGETPDFIEAGGAVCFSFELETLHFEVNLGAANDAHLKINAGMLSLARRVVNKPEVAKS